IMVYRACGMSLADISDVLSNPSYDARGVLAHHLATLAARKRELETLMNTVEKTIRSLEGECEMTNEEKFEGLKRAAIADNEARYGTEARKRYGDVAVDAANEKLLAMDQREWNDMNELEQAIIEQLKVAMAEGDPQGAAARELGAMHARWIEMHWGAGAYSPEAHRGLAQGYLADNRFRAYYDERAGEGATEFLVQAIEAYLG
ncbi:MAG: TipAS antibiotic-recognition domain-containing protein, partial [Eggerthellaceae bacterium]|nr:TipAS antibiotic-recognition domain-containing protein [Eggerthellaceae bacterium]